MLKILDCPLSRLQNEEHYKFHTDVNGLITFYTAATLLIETEYDAYFKSYTDEGEALNFVRKSTYSDLLHADDLKRNETIDGMGDAINSGLKHYSQAVRDAANRLKILWNTNGDIKGKSQQNKSGAITKLISDLKGMYSSDIATLGMNGWVSELEKNNSGHDTTEKNRFDEQDAKTNLRMKEVRVDIDAHYRSITEKINALIIVNGETPYIDFVNKLNLRVEAYINALAMRKGKGPKPSDPKA